VIVRGDAISQLWLFIVAPIIGAVIAALIWKYCFEEKETAPAKK
jgi:aquaporin Z